MGSFFSSRKSFFAFCLVALLLVFLVSSLVLSRPNPDEGIHTTSAWLLLKGLVPYRDVFSMYAPATYFILAAFYLFFPLDFVVSRLFMLFLNVLTLVSFYALCRKFFGERLSLLASLLFVVLIVFTISWNVVMEPFLLLFSVLAFLFAFSFLDGKKTRDLVLAALFLSCMVLLKQTMLFLSLGMAVFLLVAGRPNKSQFLAGLVSYVFFPFLFLVYLVSNNAFFDFWEQAVVYNLSHSSLFAFRFHLGWFLVTSLFFSVVLFALLLVALKRVRAGSARVVALFLWFVLSLFTLLPVLGCCGHHLPLVPSFVIFFMLCFEAVFYGRGFSFRRYGLSVVPKLFLAFVFLAAVIGPFAYLSQFFFQDDFSQLFEVASFVSENSSEDDTIFVTYWDEEIYFFSLRQPATRYLYQPFLFPEEEPLFEAESIASFEANRPIFVVNFSRGETPLEGDSLVYSYIRENYSVERQFKLSKPLYDTFNYAFVLKRNG